MARKTRRDWTVGTFEKTVYYQELLEMQMVEILEVIRRLGKLEKKATINKLMQRLGGIEELIIQTY